MTFWKSAFSERWHQLLPKCAQPTHIVGVLGGAIRGTQISDKRSRTHANREKKESQEGREEESGQESGEEEEEVACVDVNAASRFSTLTDGRSNQ